MKQPITDKLCAQWEFLLRPALSGAMCRWHLPSESSPNVASRPQGPVGRRPPLHGCPMHRSELHGTLWRCLQEPKFKQLTSVETCGNGPKQHVIVVDGHHEEAKYRKTLLQNRGSVWKKPKVWSLAKRKSFTKLSNVHKEANMKCTDSPLDPSLFRSPIVDAKTEVPWPPVPNQVHRAPLHRWALESLNDTLFTKQENQSSWAMKTKRFKHMSQQSTAKPKLLQPICLSQLYMVSTQVLGKPETTLNLVGALLAADLHGGFLNLPGCCWFYTFSWRVLCTRCINYQHDIKTYQNYCLNGPKNKNKPPTKLPNNIKPSRITRQIDTNSFFSQSAPFPLPFGCPAQHWCIQGHWYAHCDCPALEQPETKATD